MYLHTAFGLIIESPFPLPAETLYDLSPSQQVDVSIVCQEYLTTRRYSHNQECSISATPGEIVMRWEDIGEFCLRDGKEIAIRRRPGVSEDILNLFISGSVFAMLLHQRGMTTLHGSVVAVENQGIAFLAPKGAGKSTLALAMHGIGATLISDDIVALPATSRLPMVTCGFAQARLWPDSLAELGYAIDQHTKLRDEVEKRGFVIRFADQEPVALRHIFILGKAEEATILPLNERDALLTLLPHWYLARYGTATVKGLQATGLQFLHCLELVQKVQVSALLRPQSLAKVPKVAEALRAYVTSGVVPNSNRSTEEKMPDAFPLEQNARLL